MATTAKDMPAVEASTNPNGVKFDATKDEYKLIRIIAKRAQQIYKNNGIERELIEIEMDLSACHSNGCPLDFDKLASFDNFNLMHDVGGIARHIDRQTGELRDCFLPRCSR